MVDWQDPDVQRFCSLIFSQAAVFVAGVYIWYYILTFPDVEFRLFSGKVKPALAHIPYFVARYSHLLSVILVAIISNSSIPLLTCQNLVLLRTAAVLGNLSFTTTSANLGFRALVLWKDHIWAVVLVIVMCAGHMIYSVVLGIVGVDKHQSMGRGPCDIVMKVTRIESISLYILTALSIDFAILCLTLFGLRRQNLWRRYPLTSSLFNQGMLYVMISTVTCVIMTVFESLKLNSSMNIIPTVPGYTISVIASSASVLSLLKTHGGEESPEASSDDDSSDLPETLILTNLMQPPVVTIASELQEDTLTSKSA